MLAVTVFVAFAFQSELSHDKIEQNRDIVISAAFNTHHHH